MMETREWLNLALPSESTSSRDVAKVCGKTHGHVLRDIKELNKVYARVGLPPIQFTKYLCEENGIEYREAILTPVQRADLITGYFPEARFDIIRRASDLEDMQSVFYQMMLS